MSWIFSLVFAGMFVSSGIDDLSLPAAPPDNQGSCTLSAALTADETEKFEQSYPISANGRVSVSNINGSIEVVAWDRNEVKLEVTKSASTREALDLVDLKIDSRADSFSVQTDYKNWRTRDLDAERNIRLEVQIRISVPRTADLNEIGTINGSVKAANFVNNTKISAVNGSVNVTNLSGKANLSTVNGSVVADFEKIDIASRIHLSTVNGRISLTIPSDANATVKAESVHGPITNNFGLPVKKGEFIGRNMHGRLGNGDVKISLSSVNGPLAINKKNDGGSTAPATNLLTSEGDGGTWDDSTGRLNVNLGRIDRDVERAVRDAQRALKIAEVETGKALENIRLTEIEKLKTDVNARVMDKAFANSMRMQAVALERMRENMWLGSPSRIEKRSKSFEVKGVPKVTITGESLNIRVRGWDKSEVRYSLTELSRANGSNVTINENHDGSEIKIEIKDAEIGWRGSGSVPRLEIFVPKRSDLNISTEGEVRVDGVSGSFDIKGQEESVDIRDSDGELNVTSGDGMIRIIGFKGDLIAKTLEGDVFLDGEFTTVNGTSEDGRFIITLPADADVRIDAASPAVAVQGFDNAKQISENIWQLGKGSRNYKFSSDSEISVRSRDQVVGQ